MQHNAVGVLHQFAVFVLALKELFLGPLELGDVPGHRDRMRASADDHRAGRDGGENFAAVAASKPSFGFAETIPLQGLEKASLAVGIPPKAHVEGGFSEHFFRRVAEQLDQRLVDPHKNMARLGVEQADTNRRSVEDRFEFLFAMAKS